MPKKKARTKKKVKKRKRETGEVKIENVVASVTLNQRVDLHAIVRAFDNIEYRPEQFPGLVFRLDKPKTATLIFGSGKMVCTGAKSERMAREAVKKVVQMLKEKGIIIKAEPKIEIQNIVASANLGKNVDLELAAEKLEKSLYEPEQFPGLIYQMTNPKVVILLFASGKLVCTGAKKEEMAYEAIEKLKARLEREGILY